MSTKQQAIGPTVDAAHGQETSAMLWALLGVLMFSFTLPMTRLCAPVFGGLTVGVGRCVVAGLLAALLLWSRRERLPERRHWRALGWTALGVVFGFPWLSSIALQLVDASHGSVTNGLLPAATAVVAVVLGRERPRPLFWLVCALGVVATLLYGLSRGAGSLAPGDLFMLLAVALAAIGYAEGGKLAKELEGWRVISWVLALSLPISLLALPLVLLLHGPIVLPITPITWLSFGYVSVFSAFLGFFAWYKGLALGSVAKTGQVQLMQTPLAVLWSFVLLGEHFDILTVLAAGFMVLVAVLSRFTRM
jgi:drug/metabolite transporter (DMT)-like permease